MCERRLNVKQIIAVLMVLVTLSGCALRRDEIEFDPDSMSAWDATDALLRDVEYEDVYSPVHADPSLVTDPLSIEDSERQPWLLAVDDAIQIALSNSRLFRDLGGAVLQSPSTVRTIHGPAIEQTDPQRGIEAALSAFDAELAASAFFDNNDFVVNNRLLGGGSNVIKQDLAAFSTEISKRSATGTKLAIRHLTDYDANNAPGNLFGSSWTTRVETEIRHPLLQGSGLDFNRTAGPGATLNQMNGVVIARVNADISLADFEIGVRELVNNVENAYWDLYFAYRDLEAKIAARDAALTTWRSIEALGGAADKEAQAREQYYRFHEEVQNALTGRLFDGTTSNNGSSGGTFRGVPGVQVAERRLRLLMGLPISDGYTLRPAQDPPLANVVFDWQQIATEAIFRRAELRKQRLQVRRNEMELAATRNFLLPRLDAVGRYRWRGFGHALLDPNRDGKQRFDNAFMDLTSGDFQEWQLGVELSFPIGQRQAHSALRNRQLDLARQRVILDEQERQVIHDLSNAWADCRRAYEICKTAFNRRVAARTQLAILKERERPGFKVDVNTMLDAQNRAADADSRYFRTLVEYVMAIKNVHYEKGTLLDYDNIQLAERIWPEGPCSQSAAHQPETQDDGQWPRPTVPNPEPASPQLQDWEAPWPRPTLLPPATDPRQVPDGEAAWPREPPLSSPAAQPQAPESQREWPRNTLPSSEADQSQIQDGETAWPRAPQLPAAMPQPEMPDGEQVWPQTSIPSATFGRTESQGS